MQLFVSSFLNFSDKTKLVSKVVIKVSQEIQIIAATVQDSKSRWFLNHKLLKNWMTTTCWVYSQLVNTCCVTMNCWLIVNVPWSPVSLNPAEHKNQSPPAPPDHLFTSSLLKLFYMKDWVQRIHSINYTIKWNCWLPGMKMLRKDFVYLKSKCT